MTPPDPALLGAFVVGGIAAAVDIYLAGGARLAGSYEKERKKFYDDNWQKCRELDELAGLDFTRALITSDLWRLSQSGRSLPAESGTEGEATVLAVEAQVQQKTARIRKDLESLLEQFRSRTGHKERLERAVALFDRCANRTRQAWAAFAILVAAVTFAFAGYISESAQYTSSIEGVLVIVAIAAGLILYGATVDWIPANRDLKKCRRETEAAIHAKIHFREAPVRGLQTPPATPPPPSTGGGAVPAGNAPLAPP
jgi:hypothetical protein